MLHTRSLLSRKPMLALMFPGQGTQTVGMGAALVKSSKIARDTFQEADDILKEHMSSLMLNGRQETLDLTRNAQPAILTHSVAVLRVLKDVLGAKEPSDLCSFVMGHSLGEYSALVAANVITFQDALRAVRSRGEAMQAACPVGQGAMIAIMPISHIMASYLCREVEHETGAVCEIANINSSSQVVLSGEVAAINRATELAKQRYGVMKIVPLDVSAPFHCRLMKPAAAAMQRVLANIPFNPPAIPVVINLLGAQESDPERLRSGLVEQIVHTVHWHESVRYTENAGVTHWLELGPGPKLASLVRRSRPSNIASCLQSLDDIEAFANEWTQTLSAASASP